jgi:predicted transposase YdaD
MKTDTWYYPLMQALPSLPFQLIGLPIPTVPYQFESIELKAFQFHSSTMPSCLAIASP